MSWTVQQQAMLEAMGYTLWRTAGATPDVPAPRDDAPAPRAATRDEDPLLRALRRAAGGRDPSAVLPPLDRLRGDAAAKRALWPRLRALRRRGR